MDEIDSQALSEDVISNQKLKKSIEFQSSKRVENAQLLFEDISINVSGQEIGKDSGQQLVQYSDKVQGQKVHWGIGSHLEMDEIDSQALSEDVISNQKLKKSIEFQSSKRVENAQLLFEDISINVSGQEIGKNSGQQQVQCQDKVQGQNEHWGIESLGSPQETIQIWDPFSRVSRHQLTLDLGGKCKIRKRRESCKYSNLKLGKLINTIIT
eukprot:TRINITY_DN24083_c0_g1_i2.p2 TRINITY_DN24083_c0_g1~~TRINITY_DN24083_c0_g1_i2.p2  ORF type:complete len:245 (-),score=-1.48 TRINITY_DN24083_c0_g1_i2:91-723(-)